MLSSDLSHVPCAVGPPQVVVCGHPSRRRGPISRGIFRPSDSVSPPLAGTQTPIGAGRNNIARSGWAPSQVHLRRARADGCDASRLGTRAHRTGGTAPCAHRAGNGQIGYRRGSREPVNRGAGTSPGDRVLTSVSLCVTLSNVMTRASIHIDGGYFTKRPKCCGWVTIGTWIRVGAHYQ